MYAALCTPTHTVRRARKSEQHPPSAVPWDLRLWKVRCTEGATTSKFVQNDILNN